MGTLTSAPVKDRYTKLVWYNTSDNRLYKTTEDGTDADFAISPLAVTGFRLQDNTLRNYAGVGCIFTLENMGLSGDEHGISINNLDIDGQVKLKTDGESIRWGANGEVILSHVHNTGLIINTLTSLTNASVTSLRLFHQTSGTPAAGIGNDMVFQVETSVSSFKDGMKIAAIATDVSGGAEDFDYVLSLMEGGSAAAERMRVTSAGDLSISGNIKLAAAKKIYLDGGTHTYFHESSNDVVQLAGGLQTEEDASTSTRLINMTPKSLAGYGNTVYGQDAGSNLDSGSTANTYFGGKAGDATHSNADQNTGIGYIALSKLTTGNGNTAIGRGSMYEATLALYNTAVGTHSLDADSRGTKSVAIGYSALTAQNFDGSVDGGNVESRNVAIGFAAGGAITYGKQNVVIGYHAGNDITTGKENIVIGHGAETSAVDTDNEIVIGHDLTGVGANKIIIGNTSHTDMWISDQFNFDIANTEFVIHDDQDTGDLFSIQVAQHGATTIKTVDDDSHAAHLNIEADGHVEFDNCSVGFDLLTPTYNASDTDVSFINGNKQFVTFGSGNITDLNLIFPKTSGNFTLLVKQDGTGSRTITNYKAWDIVNSDAASGSATVKFAGGSNPTLTTDANHVDILSFFWDADNQIAYGVATLDFQF